MNKRPKANKRLLMIDEQTTKQLLLLDEQTLGEQATFDEQTLGEQATFDEHVRRTSNFWWLNKRPKANKRLFDNRWTNVRRTSDFWW